MVLIVLLHPPSVLCMTILILVLKKVMKLTDYFISPVVNLPLCKVYRPLSMFKYTLYSSYDDYYKKK